MRTVLALIVLLALASYAKAQCGCGNSRCSCGNHSASFNGNGNGHSFSPARYYTIQEVPRSDVYYGRPAVRYYTEDRRQFGNGFSLNMPRLGLSLGN